VSEAKAVVDSSGWIEAAGDSDRHADTDALEAALKQLERSTARTESALDAALSEVRAALNGYQS